MSQVTCSVTKMCLKFSTSCDGCGRMFRFESSNLADLDSSRWPTKCDDCRTPKAELMPRKRRGKR